MAYDLLNDAMAGQGYMLDGAPMGVYALLPLSQFEPPTAERPPPEELDRSGLTSEPAEELDDVLQLHPGEDDDVDEELGPYDVNAEVAKWTKPYD